MITNLDSLGFDSVFLTFDKKSTNAFLHTLDLSIPCFHPTYKMKSATSPPTSYLLLLMALSMLTLHSHIPTVRAMTSGGQAGGWLPGYQLVSTNLATESCVRPTDDADLDDIVVASTGHKICRDSIMIKMRKAATKHNKRASASPPTVDPLVDVNMKKMKIKRV